MEKKKKKKKKRKKKFWQLEKNIVLLEIILAFFVLLCIIGLLVYYFTLNRYIVTFDSFGGNQVPSQKVIQNHEVQEPREPTREGYEFVGWFYQEKPFDFDTKVHQDLKLEAKWEIKNKE